MAIGSKGVIEVFEDFMAPDTSLSMATSPQRLGQVGQVSVNEGSYAHVIDEPGGILQITTDTGDNDNTFLYAGPFRPSDGGVVMEVRFKIADITTGAVFAGFSETLDATTPVMPLEFDTATMSYSGSGGIAGWSFDADGSTDTWRAAVGDGGSATGTGGATAGTVTGRGAPVNDEWDILRVEIDPNGTVRCYHDDPANGPDVTITGGLTATDIQHACLGIENRSSAASVMEVDYFYARGYRDWTV